MFPSQSHGVDTEHAAEAQVCSLSVREEARDCKSAMDWGTIVGSLQQKKKKKKKIAIGPP